MGDFEKAIRFNLEAIAIQEKIVGKEDPDYAWSLNNLANSYWKVGDYKKAELLNLEAKDIREKVLGKEPPDYAWSLISLANLYFDMGDYGRAEPLFEQLAYLNQSVIVKALRHLSERESNIYLQGFSLDQDQILSFAQLTVDKKFHTTEVCYDNILFYKGFLLYAANQVKRLALSNPTFSEKFYLLKSYERRLAIEYAKPISERINVPEFEEAANLLEKDLARTATGYGQAFGDRHSIVLLGSTRQLVVPTNSAKSTSTAYLVGGVRYDTDSMAITYANRSTTSRSKLAFQPDSLRIDRSGVLDYLPASVAEVSEIRRTLDAAGIDAQVDTGFYATEEAFRQLGSGFPSPRIVHLATHGYFFPDPEHKAQKTAGNFGQELIFKLSEPPMIRSGLILAGAKQAWLPGWVDAGFRLSRSLLRLPLAGSPN